MNNEVRKSGIDIIGNVPWGTHFCQFYQTKQDLIDTLVPYFKAGLENNEFCMWVTADNLTADDARKAISKAVPNFSRYVKKGQIEILPYDEWYLKDGVFKSQDVLDGWVAKLNQALEKGFDGLRLTGNTFWLEKEGWQSFTDYEEAVNNVIGKFNMVALCTYCLDKCDATEIVDVIRNHEFAMIKQAGKWELFENSRYKTTKEALVQSERRFQQLYHSMTEGLALHSVVYDKAGKAIDYIITDVNPAYEQITGIRAGYAIGRKASALYGANEPPYLDIYTKVAGTGEATKFETYFPPMGKHFNVSVFSPEKGKFATVFSDITEKKLDETKLRENEEKLRIVTDFTFDWEYWRRPDNTFAYVSPSCERITGYTNTEFMENPELYLSIVHPDDHKLLEHHMREDILNLEPFEMEFRIIRCDGQERWIGHACQPVLDANGNSLGRRASNRDITERKQMEEELRNSQHDLNRAQTVAKIGSWRLDIQHNKLLWSDETYRIFGIPQGTPMTYDLFLSTIFPEDKEYVDRKWAAALRGETYDIEHRVIVGGKIKWVREKADLEFDEEHQVKGGFGTVQDITERKNAEEKLRETSDYLNNLLDYANAPIIVWDPQFHITRFNHAFERLTGIVASEAIGKHLDILFPESSKTDSMALIRRTSAGERWEAVEIPILGPDGSIRTVLWNSATLVGVDGKRMVATIAQGQDITDRKRAEEAVRNLNEELKHHASELEAANKELEAFSYSVSHDLRAPLRSMEGFSQALLEDYSEKLDEEGLDYLRRIGNSADTMSQLIDDLLRLSRLTRFDMRFEAVNLSKLAEAVAASLQKTQPGRKVRFSITPEIVAQADEKLLAVVLDNLLGNAWKFTGNNPTAEIEFGVSEKDGKKAYFVRDNGVGFDSKYVDKLFKPFQRLHSANDFPGTGIGLASVQRIIQRHGGRVWAEGNPGKGAKFYFTLG